MAEAGRTVRRARRRASRALQQGVPLWMVAAVVVVAGALVVGVLLATSGGDDGTAQAGTSGGAPAAVGSTATSTSCIDVLTRADQFVDAGEGNAEMFVAVDPETGDWAVQLTPEEEACGLRLREIVDRLSSPAVQAPPSTLDP